MTQDISPELIEQARRQLEDPRLARIVLDHCRYLPGTRDQTALDTKVHPECQMLAHSLRIHRDAALAVSQYFTVALQQYHTVGQIMDRVFDRPREVAFLDFACGYGRLLRFLVHAIAPERIWAAEIQPDAVAYVRDRFGTHALRSSERPEDFDPGRQFDMIWVASLFSHLPTGLFERWLERLARLLTPTGVICFSVHDQALLPDDMAMPEAGLLYIPSSENSGLDPEIYGTTFVTGEYVRRIVDRVFGPGHPLIRKPKLLAHEQDVYIVPAQPQADLSALDRFRRGERGWLDSRSVDAQGRVNLNGWAAGLDDEPAVQVDIRLDGQSHVLPADEPRPKVAEVLKDPRLDHCGFSCSLPLPGGRAEAYLTVSAVNREAERTLIFAGPVVPPVPPGEAA